MASNNRHPFYSVRIAEIALRFIARLAGKYPDIMPTTDENINDAKQSHTGIEEILEVPPIPPIMPPNS